MKCIIVTHSILIVLVTAVFFSLGVIDKARLNKASSSYKPQLLFSHSKNVASDGGSIYWESLVYNAHEGRRFRVWKEDGDTKVADGFQGVSWTWKYHNLVWIWLILAGSFIGCLITSRKTKLVEQGRAHQSTTRSESKSK